MPRMKIIFCDTSLLFKLTAVVTSDTMEGLQSEAMSDEMKIFLYRGWEQLITMKQPFSSPNGHRLHLHSFQIHRFLSVIIDIKVEIEFNDS